MIAFTKLGTLKGSGPAIWYETAGYVTNTTELSEIFQINFITLRNRIASNWNIAPACLVGNTMNMSLKETTGSASSNAFDEQFVNKLRTHFNRPSLAMFKA